VAATPAVRPADDVLAYFSALTGTLLGAMARSDRESRALAAIRDALLPKLISGKKRVQAVHRNADEQL